MRKNTSSGQALLLGVLIFVALLITIPVVIFVNHMISKHSADAARKLKGRAISEEGVSFAVQQLSSATLVANPPQTAGDQSPGGPIMNDNANFITQNVPAFLVPGQAFVASLTFQNTGTNNWDVGVYQLGSRNAMLNNTWGLTLVDLNPLESIIPGNSKTFFFTSTAPLASGNYQFQWGMRHSPSGRYFGEFSPSFTIAVQPAPVRPPNWPYQNMGGGGGMPPEATIPSTQGGSFSVLYTSAPAPGLQSYQVGVLVRPLDSAGNFIPASSLFATISQRTLGAKLTNGLTAPAALELMRVPNQAANSQLRVEFGPIVIRDDAVFTLDTTARTIKRPRKIAQGGIDWRTTDPGAPTDQKEYWAYTSPGVASVIDNALYIARAKTSTCPVPACTAECGAGIANPSGSCYFDRVDAGTATFNAVSLLSTGPDKFVYINGNAAIINSATVNLASGAFIVNGNLILGNNNQPATVGTVTNVRIPPNVGLEDPFCTCGEPLCIGAVTRHIDLQGFFYVKGNVHLDTSFGALGAPHNWTLDGTARIDGTLQMDTGTTLFIFYNDVINHRVRTTNFELQVDSTTVMR